MTLNYKEMEHYQEYWKESQYLSDEKKECLMNLSNKLISQAKLDNDQVDNVTLLYPEDCSDLSIFQDFASVIAAKVTIRPEGGAKIYGIGLYTEVDVE